MLGSLQKEDGSIHDGMLANYTTSAAILARQLGGDTQTMASIITFQTLLAFVAMPGLALLLPA